MAEGFVRHKQPWTSDEIQKLHRLAAKGMALKALGKALTLADTLKAPPEDWGLEARGSLLARTATARVVTDDNMVTEWRERFPEVEP